MPLVSPDEIADKVSKAYPRFLKSWVLGKAENFFPYRVRVRLKLDPQNPKETFAAHELLLSHSKIQRGWGYTVHREKIRKRDFGTNLVPTAITVDTLDDFLRLAKKQTDFYSTQTVAEKVRLAFPQLEDWLICEVSKIAKLADSVDGLIQVAHYLIEHPLPDCYIRQLPVPIDTKFVERNESILKQWLDKLLPASAINVNETRLIRRFGFRDGQTHHSLRLLDPGLSEELNLPFDELSLPLRYLAALDARNTSVFIVENNLNLLTLPSYPRGLAIRGEGNAVTRLEELSWLNQNQLLYWGDIDVEGFLILSRLRNIFPHVRSIMMDLETLHRHEAAVVKGNPTKPDLPVNLTEQEAEAFDYCLKNQCRLEQERILQDFVEATIGAIPSGTTV
ncbi:Wadjet anti-phage system protein JetD domain-containing protein [uncultured Gimesia sp.]|uniref:Wadjet anti-phage system protein JetD domain-containing protein n=1 Tax=uncultured Gimesia sp. TaxID=1678688 RepID=UPI0030D97581|tara:strand:- start:15984 stop:17159 length:1176 start_codon:yes stop_codon:yes gene_type:complete